jgi:MFS superfamily sulfate permease-like transporter
MQKSLIKILAILVMIPIMFIGIAVGIIWNLYLIANHISFRLKRKWVAGIKEVKKHHQEPKNKG